jgi:hypothetical protein
MRHRLPCPERRALSRRSQLVLGSAAVLVLACSGSPPTSIPSDGSLRVLFVGNSHSRSNALPQVVQALADSAGGRPIHIGEVIYGGVSLEDHWHARVALDSIATRRWDVVVLQQGPSSLDASRANLITWTGHFASRIRAAGGEPALYQIWPEDYRRDAFDRVLESYRLAAESVNGELLPAGAAWIAAWQRDPTLPLYAPDGAHASPIGTYLVALTIYAELLDRSPLGLPSRLTIGGGVTPFLDIPPAQAALLQAAADEVTRGP